MIVCPKCSAKLPDQARFCTQCGGAIPVDDAKTIAMEAMPDLVESSPAPMTQPESSTGEPPAAAAPAPRPPTLESPAFSQQVPTPRHLRFPSEPTIKAGAPVPLADRDRPKGEPAIPAPARAGSKVNVRWSDGATYAATVVQTSATHSLVALESGHTQWVEHRFVEPLKHR